MRRTVSCLAIAGLSFAAVGCGGEDAAESLIENAIEREGGGDVDLDFGDGGFSVETEDGSMTIDEDGNMVIVGPDGEVVTGQVDSEDGSFQMEGEDGSFSMESGDDGSFTIESDDGTFTGGATTDVPDEWPDEAPEPTGFAIVTSSQFSDGANLNVSVIGTSDNGAEWVAGYSAALESAGFEEQSRIESAGSVLLGYQQGDLNVTFQTADNGDGTWGISVIASRTES